MKLPNRCEWNGPGYFHILPKTSNTVERSMRIRGSSGRGGPLFAGMGRNSSGIQFPARIERCMSDGTKIVDTIDIKRATESKEFRAAAHLRALSFYTYPADRSEYARRAHVKMRTDAEWESIENKIKGLEVGYEKVGVVCMIGTVPTVRMELSNTPDFSLNAYKLPESTGGLARYVVGTLDINKGPKLPAEELMGTMPLKDPSSRGYLSNVCTFLGARRLGIAKSLVLASFSEARMMGIRVLYVHVVDSNLPAIKLYEAAGFCKESEESIRDSQLLGRPRRLLLRTELS